MLRRISKIQNVGLFADCSLADVQFSKWTVIYGRNTYGKSTLTDIFGSLERNDPLPIKNRKSIPEAQKTQRVELSFCKEGENEGEGRAIFNSDHWEVGLRKSHNLAVYDDTFYHSHLFTSQKFTRDTKTKFSAFILGESGVQNAELISEKKKLRDKIGRDLRRFEDSHFRDVQPIDEFLALKVAHPKIELADRHRTLGNEYQAIKKQLSDISAVTRRQQLTGLHDISGNIEALEHFNETLRTSIETVHLKAQELIDSHVNEHIAATENPFSWFRAGLSFGNNVNCQFCGQLLKDEALKLVSAYASYFNEEYRSHINSMSKILDRGISILKEDLYLPLLLTLERNKTVISEYPELLEQPNFQSFIAKSEAYKIEITTLIEKTGTEINQVLEEALIKSEQKKQSPQDPIEALGLAELTKLTVEISRLVNQYNMEVTTPINEVLTHYKEQANTANLNSKLAEITAEGTLVGRMIKRHERSAICEEYIQLKSEHESLIQELPELEKKLQSEQSDFLDRFFDRINQSFKELGGSDFHLVKAWDRNGHTPICYLQVMYKNKKVKDSNLDKVFSESDRRSLSLSLFFAKLDSMEKEDRLKTVVVFDDPVTSFDEHRVSATHRKISYLVNDVEQVIMLSHFREGISNLLKKHLKSGLINVIEIKKKMDGSTIVMKRPNDLTRSVHERMRDQVFDFIDRKRDSIQIPLRVFLEEELKVRFAQQYRASSLEGEQLGTQIDRLWSAGSIDEDTHTKLDKWKNELNPDSHQFSGDDLEDQRNNARQFMNFLYQELVPSMAIAPR